MTCQRGSCADPWTCPIVRCFGDDRHDSDAVADRRRRDADRRQEGGAGARVEGGRFMAATINRFVRGDTSGSSAANAFENA